MRALPRGLAAAGLTLLTLLAASPAAAAGGKTITVNFNTDAVNGSDGHCTLPEAVAAANTNTASGSAAGECAAGGTGTDTINFSTGAATIHLTTNAGLDVGAPAVIDGGGLVTIHADAVGTNCIIFGDTSKGSTLKGIRLGGCDVGVNIFASSITLIDNWIGTENGLVSAGGGVGIETMGASTRIGQAGHGNVISGITTAVEILGGKGTVIQGNRIGTTAAGDAALPNTTGIDVGNLASATLIGGTLAGQGNLVSGSAIGIDVEVGAKSTKIERNFIGTDAFGTTAIPNTRGIFDPGGVGTMVGGAMPAAGNLIAGNGTGIEARGLPGASITISGNVFGLGSDGTSILPNATGVAAVSTGKVTVKGNLFANQTTVGLGYSDAPSNLGSGSTMNCFDGSNVVGAANTTLAPIALAQSWWGTPFGPNTPTADTTSGPISPDKFLTKPPSSCLGWAPKTTTPADPGFAARSSKVSKFSWAKVPTATLYTYQLFTAGGPIILSTPTTGASFTSPAPLDYGRYFWRTATSTPDQIGWSSAIHTFDVTIMKAPKPGTIFAKTGPVKFSWGKPSPAPVGNYTWSLYLSSDCTAVFMSDGAITGTSTTKTIGAGTYYWRISYNNGSGTVDMPCWAINLPI